MTQPKNAQTFRQRLLRAWLDFALPLSIGLPVADTLIFHWLLGWEPQYDSFADIVRIFAIVNVTVPFVWAAFEHLTVMPPDDYEEDDSDEEDLIGNEWAESEVARTSL
jgi:hypothetical protein